MAARAGFEPPTLRTKDVDYTNGPPRPTKILEYLFVANLYDYNRTYFNVQLITINFVQFENRNVQCKICSCCILNWPIAVFCAVVNPA